MFNPKLNRTGTFKFDRDLLKSQKELRNLQLRRAIIKARIARTKANRAISKASGHRGKLFDRGTIKARNGGKKRKTRKLRKSRKSRKC